MTDAPKKTVPSVMYSLINATNDALEICPGAAAEFFCAVIEEQSAAEIGPAMFGDVESDANWFASKATTIDLEAYLAAISARLSETQMHRKTRKRLIASLFNKMDATDKAAFVKWVWEKEKYNE
jgi:hypothetical protein